MLKCVKQCRNILKEVKYADKRCSFKKCKSVEGSSREWLSEIKRMRLKLEEKKAEIIWKKCKQYK